VSAVIYAAIVVMWAIVLVPMWLRRHDAATEAKSVDRFSTAMRTLSRRTHATPGRRYVVMPRREAGTLSVHVSGASAQQRAHGSRRPSAPAAQRSRASLVARRRRALLVLASVVVLTFPLAVAGVISWPLQLVLDLVLGAFVAHLRAQARRTAVVSRRRRRATAAPARASAPRPMPMPAREPAAPVVVPETIAATVTTDVAVAMDVAAESGGAEVTWEPIPVPPPTYTLKPAAPPAAPAAPAASYQPDAVAVDDGTDDLPSELDEILERRWAVND
jgi:hypothetical protein